MLLQWCNLQPLGPSNLAAIRFASPSRVHSVKIFATGAKPFANFPDIVARTEPGAFFMDVYFNAHPIPSSSQADAKHKLKAPNALIPTVIAYSGRNTEFSIDMGADFGTRLMIVRGDFESVSMAIYGESELSSTGTSYIPGPLQLPNPVSVSPALDLAKASDPTSLARQLLASVPDAPSLNLVIRLMFCLKPPNDDWDLPDYPHLYSDLSEEEFDIDLDSAFHCLSRPVADNIQLEPLQRFAEKVADAIGPMDDIQADLVAGILCRSASQHPDFAQALMQAIDLERVFDVPSLDDEDTILTLLDASTNPDVARLLYSDWFKGILQSLEALPTARREVKKGAQRLAARLRDWQIFESALSNTGGSFVDACRFLKDVGSEEKSFGIWLSCMTTHEDLLATVRNDLPPDYCPLISLLDQPPTSISYDDFIGFVKAYIGVASVLAVYAWSDSLPNDNCRERTLAVLRLWQDVPGYREIVNHLLLLRQMTFRLECMTTDNDPPAQSGIHAENIILNLVNEPRCYLSSHFVKCIRSWQPFSLTYINEEERISLDRAATIADDGLPGAIDELVRSDFPSVNLDRIRGLRVAVAVVLHEFEEDDLGDWNILEAGWKEKVHGLMFHVIDVVASVSQELKSLYSLTMAQPREGGIAEQLLLLSDELLRLVIRLEHLSVTTSRSMRNVVTAVADIFVCADLALSPSTSSSSVVATVKCVRQTCVDVLRALSESRGMEFPRQGPTLFLRTLFEHGLRADNIDPAHRIVQIYTLIDCLVPEGTPEAAESNSEWVLSVIPLILTNLGTFFRALDVDQKIHFVDKLVALDNGTLNIGEWLLTEELKHMAEVARLLGGGMRDPRYIVAQHEVNLCLQFTARLMDPFSMHSSMCITTICTTPEAGHALTDTITSMLSARLHSKYLAQIARILASSTRPTECSLRLAVALTLVRGASLAQLSMPLGGTFGSTRAVLSTVSEPDLALDRLLWEFGHSLSAIVGSCDSLDSLDVQSIVAVLAWLCDKLPGPSDLPGLSWDKWDKLCDMFENGVLPDMYGSLKSIKGKLTPLPDSSIPTVLIPDSLSLPVHALASLLQPPVPVPSTPKRKSPGRDVLGLVALSPPTALLRSPAISGLSKMYTRNDFRELRQTPSSRQNTSRLPSLHVDEFEFGAPSPLVQPVAGAGMPTDPMAFGLGAPFPMT
ncbi:hypothetical protein PAXRUDRAFT_33290 [Paxillus rubicundulus Ve08.2h10]|uniref:Virilizer N-terminal domain-containing protein n=1 Tax=Paxillus rubicundulus Ve08.2h10 TaxID=930991 RepID=A0A0D0DXN3_9AGAM|nr:hypothetical protein PAXRUDRAFT_33290 [Paxillus rubicundulus Ve08.2h10]